MVLGECDAGFVGQLFATQVGDDRPAVDLAAPRVAGLGVGAEGEGDCCQYDAAERAGALTGNGFVHVGMLIGSGRRCYWNSGVKRRAG